MFECNYRKPGPTVKKPGKMLCNPHPIDKAAHYTLKVGRLGNTAKWGSGVQIYS